MKEKSLAAALFLNIFNHRAFSDISFQRYFKKLYRAQA